MIDEIENKLEELLNDIVCGEDETAKKIAEHIQKIKALDIDEESRRELLEDAQQIIEVEKESAELEAKIKLEKAYSLLTSLAELAI